MMPRISEEEKSKELRDWDLWGPLIFCLMLALTLSISSKTENIEVSSQQGSVVFGIVFVVVWIGSAVVTVNAQLLGGTVSFFHSVCLLGYCLFPLNIAALVLAFMGNISIFINLAIVLLGFGWSTFSSIGFMAGLVPSTRKALAEYPVLLFYLFLAWFILVIS
jgi:protein YIPF6